MDTSYWQCYYYSIALVVDTLLVLVVVSLLDYSYYMLYLWVHLTGGANTWLLSTSTTKSKSTATTSTTHTLAKCIGYKYYIKSYGLKSVMV